MTELAAAGPDQLKYSVFPLLREDNVEYVIAKAVSLTDSSVTLSNGETVSFDGAVVATGCKFPVFQVSGEVESLDERKQELNGFHDKIQKANTIVIAGGGAVGSELAADVKLRNPNKRYVQLCVRFFILVTLFYLIELSLFIINQLSCK